MATAVFLWLPGTSGSPTAVTYSGNLFGKTLQAYQLSVHIKHAKYPPLLLDATAA